MKSRYVGAESRICLLLLAVGATVWAGCGGAMRSAKAPKVHQRLENSSVHITEIHFNPTPAQGNVEFVEITNTGAQPVDVSGWKVTGAGPVTLPKGTTLNAGQAAVLCKDVAAFKKTFGATLVPIGVLTGKLKGKGDTVRVEDPTGKMADEAVYEQGKGPIQEASNTGRSLHRIKFDGDAATSWKAADPSPGTWATAK